ncbi:Uncharacterized protein dnm_072340 [Desulfonema magnum]|uniref:Transmembrane protein n=1 Tax=Desulfonema magnum TaxID=45655 RepID=A0A975GRM4_9BACT|nr:Uncharacterized protein dnm_072340 [Desulfonema magnum]
MCLRAFVADFFATKTRRFAKFLCVTLCLRAFVSDFFATKSRRFTKLLCVTLCLRAFVAVFFATKTRSHEGSRSFFVSLCVFVPLWLIFLPQRHEVTKFLCVTLCLRAFVADFFATKPRSHEGSRSFFVSLCVFVPLWLIFLPRRYREAVPDASLKRHVLKKCDRDTEL